MPISEELLAIIACPACKGSLVQTPDGNGLDCKRCALRYPIEDDIPALLEAAAEPIPGAASADATDPGAGGERSD